MSEPGPQLQAASDLLSPALERSRVLRAAFALALGSAVSLGLGRFSYALVLPEMRADLGWSYSLSGLMNAANAAGYLLGALALSPLLARLGARRVLILGSMLTALLLAVHGLVSSDVPIFINRLALGVASGFVFATGGLLAARLASQSVGCGLSPGLVLGIYYGGTGWGIVTSALAAPFSFEGLLSEWGVMSSPWRMSWMALGLVAFLATIAMAVLVPRSEGERGHSSAAGWRDLMGLAHGIAGYFLFGVGYIGYMTFVVTLLREGGLGPGVMTAFYVLLGLGVIGSPWLWAGLLQRHRGGGALARLNGLLAVAVIVPVMWSHPVAVFASGALFGSVFLSLVASTTAMVRHNLPQERWTAGIAAFTILFALGQILGPALVGWVSDLQGGLESGLALSALLLALGAMVAQRQKPLVKAQ
jgi:predicted MFS family arabinose efflux permease